MEFERSFTSRTKLSLTPLIDVVFLLIVFFMLTTTFARNEAMEMNFGEQAAADSGDVKHIIVEAAGFGRILLDGQEYDGQRFVSELKRMLIKHPENLIVVQSNKVASVQDVITVMDYIHRAGGTNTTFVEKLE